MVSLCIYCWASCVSFGFSLFSCQCVSILPNHENQKVLGNRNPTARLGRQPQFGLALKPERPHRRLATLVIEERECNKSKRPRHTSVFNLRVVVKLSSVKPFDVLLNLAKFLLAHIVSYCTLFAITKLCEGMMCKSITSLKLQNLNPVRILPMLSLCKKPFVQISLLHSNSCKLVELLSLHYSGDVVWVWHLLYQICPHLLCSVSSCLNLSFVVSGPQVYSPRFEMRAKQ